MFCSSAAALTWAAASWSSIATCTSQAPTTSAGSNRRAVQVARPASTCPRSAGVRSGATISIRAPAAISAGTRRVATVPPPTTSTRRPVSRSANG
jgi:hypothetical protein